MGTHVVTNQVPVLTGRSLFDIDATMREAVDRWGDPGRIGELEDHGNLAGRPVTQQWGVDADTHPPVLRTHDRSGRRLDEVDFHPAWHELLAMSVEAGLGGEAWTRSPGTGAHVMRAAGFMISAQVDNGHLCPISMTYAAVPALRTDPDLARIWLPGLASRTYEAGLRHHRDKAGILAGMGMTEKQGGSDVRANTTRAVATPGGPLPGETYRITGHKWFFSSPMSDVFLVLAQTDADSTCFVVPRVLDDGTRNNLALQRLKDKLGNRSNASSEVEFDGTWGCRLGDEGRGIRTILDMVAATRLDTILGSAATMRRAVVQAIHYARHRSAFDAALVDQPLMRNVLADLAIEVEAASLLGLWLAHQVDEGENDVSRLAVAMGKFWVCKRAVPTVAEALECLGGNGYIEDFGLARLYREAPLNSIWEGSGNVNALDVLRAVTRQPATLAALGKELALARGAHSSLDAAIDEVEQLGQRVVSHDAPWLGRRLVELAATTLQASLLVRFAPDAVAEAFVTSRVERDHGATFGTLPIGSGRVVDELLGRLLPG